jgi:sugar lactone lactonase YvrE
VAVAASPNGDLVLLDSLGQVRRLTPDGNLHLLAHLGSGHYHRTNMAVGPDGTVVVSTGFHIRRLLSISPGGTITNIAWDLGDPNGLVIDESGAIYLAETAHHRILRIAVVEMGGPDMAPQSLLDSP